MSNENKPSPAQLRSQRTVLRLQLVADQLRDDLKASGLEGIEDLFFVQRFWKDRDEFETLNDTVESSDSKLVYVANCCATWKLAEKHLLELQNAATDTGIKDGAMTNASLKALFSAYDSLNPNYQTRYGSTSFHEFKVRILDGQSTEAAHDLLIEAASALPYQGELPSAAERLFKDQLDQNLGIWFCGKDNGNFDYLLLNPADKAPTKSEINWVSLNADVHTKAVFLGCNNNTHDPLRAAFNDFLNSFLLGREPNAESSKCCYPKSSGVNSLMLVLPCFQNWTKGKDRKELRSGAFLGWVFLVLGEIENLESPATKLVAPSGETEPAEHGTNGAFSESHLNLLRLCFNHFAERVQDALLVECIREYADDGANVDPQIAFKKYFQRVEGWYCGDGAEASLAVSDTPEENFKVKPKEWTKLGDWGAANYPPTTIGRSVRLWRALCAFYGAQESEALRKYRQMMELLEAPLSRISEAVATVNDQSQELRAIIYDPAKALFECHARLAPLFADEGTLNVSDKFLSIKLSHNASYDTRPDDGKLVLAVALLRLFGKDGELRTNPTPIAALHHACQILDECEKRTAYSDLFDDLRWLLDVSGTSDPKLGGLAKAGPPTGPSGESRGCLRKFVEDGNFDKHLKTIKEVLFAPFKLHTQNWNLRAIELAVRHGFGVAYNVTLEGGAWSIPQKHSPCPYHALLSFCADLVAAQKNGSQHNYVTELKCIRTRDAHEIRLTFELEWLHPRRLGEFPRMLRENVLGVPRDWRVSGASAGDFQKPFIDLASRLLGIGDDESQWSPQPTRLIVAVADRRLKPILSVLNRKFCRRFMVCAELAGKAGYRHLVIRWDKAK